MGTIERAARLFPVATVGSWPRPAELLRGLRARRMGKMPAAEFSRLADGAVLAALRAQDRAGVDIVTDGEQRRDSFFAFVAEKLDGVRLLTLAELLDFVEDKSSFEEMLRLMDVPAYSVSNPAAVGRIARRAPLACDDFLFLRQHTAKPIKVTLPGPYLLTRALWVEGLSKGTYPSKDALADDIVAVLRAELLELVAAGADFVQFDEPVLTELVFSGKNSSRAFLCASIATRSDPGEELAFAASLLNRVIAGIAGTRTGVHICRGNWSADEATLLRGPYDPLLPYLDSVMVDQLVLEFATPRAGGLDVLAGSDKELGLGVVNPRTPQIETVEAIAARVREALRYLPAERIFLNPDCGFGAFATRPINNAEVAEGKLASVVAAARTLRAEHTLLSEQVVIPC